MKYITGQFRGKYKGKQVENLPLLSFTALHHIQIESGATLTGSEWINNYVDNVHDALNMKIYSIPNTDIYFNSSNYPDELPVRENLHSCVLLNPNVHSITRKDGYTYGTIEGILIGIIGETQKEIKIDSPDNEKLRLQSTLPLAISGSTISSGSTVSIDRHGFLRWIILALLLGWFIWRLFNHQSCQFVSDTANSNLIKGSDSTVIKKNNDTLNLSSENVIFSIYDWSVEDHDTVSLYLNGNTVRANIPLTNQTVSWVQKGLTKGSNKLVVESVNDGSIGPASPTIEINDGSNNQVFQMRVYRKTPQTLYLMIN